MLEIWEKNMVLLVFKIIFLVIFAIGVLIMLAAPLVYAKQDRNKPEVNRRVTKLRLIGLIIGAFGLLVVTILGAIK